MGKLDQMETLDGGLQPGFNIQPRVYVRKLGGEYTEIVGIKSYERSDHGSAGVQITLVMADGQYDSLRKIVLDGPDKYVEVKMEFLIGMLMIMKFSGFAESLSGNTVSFSVSSPITTDVVDILQ